MRTVTLLSGIVFLASDAEIQNSPHSATLFLSAIALMKVSEGNDSLMQLRI